MVASATAVVLMVGSGGVALAATAAKPVVSSLSTRSGTTAGHGKLTVHGSGFSRVTAVLFGGARGGAVHVLSSHTLTVTVPKHKAARLDVRVVTKAGTSAVTSHDKYTFVAPPAVGAVTPRSGAQAGSLTVTVKGSSFSHVKKVLFGRVAGTHVHVTSSKTLTVVAPAHAAGVVDVRVVTAYGTSPARVGDRFTYTAPVAPPLPPVALPSSLPTAEQGVAFTAALTSTGGTAPYTFSVSGLPAGLAATPDGHVTGTTFVPARGYPLAVSVVDAQGRSATGTVLLPVRVHAGQVLAWGDNSSGEIGNGVTSATPVPSPFPVSGLTAVVQVVGGSGTGYALRADGTVYAWGAGSSGELGRGSTLSSVVPVQVPGLFGVTSLGSAEHTAYAVQADGTVVAWGANEAGEVGDGTLTNRLSPVPVAGLSHVVSVVGSGHGAFALRSDGSVWSWGGNTYGVLGSGSTAAYSTAAAPIQGLGNVVQLASKIFNGFALKADGTVWGWGVNDQGEVGDVTTTQRDAPVQVLGLSGVTQIAAADYNAYALMADGTVRAWGQNAEGEIGDGTTTTRLSPVTVPGLTNVVRLEASAFNAFALHADGSVHAWGYGYYGGNADGTTTDRPVPSLQPSLYGATAFAAGHLAEYAIR